MPADGHDKLNSRFSQFCVPAKNCISFVRRAREPVSLTVITDVRPFPQMLRPRVPNFIHIGQQTVRRLLS